MEDISNNADIQESEPLSFFDKVTGIITEPGKVFENISNTKSKSADWVVPFFLILIFAAASVLIVMQNNVIKEDVKSKARNKIEQAFDKQVANGTMTKAEAQDGVEKAEKGLAIIGTIPGMIIQSISVIFVGGIVFFCIVAYFFLVSKLFAKTPVNFEGFLVTYGMAGYISILNIIVCIILAFVFDRQFESASLASLLNITDNGIAKFLLSKVDPFTIWAYAVFTIGLTKLSKAKSYVTYAIIVFGSWIIWSGLYFLAMKYVPFLNRFSN
jgi:hypothetical protein